MLALLTSIAGFSQEVEGAWNGELNVAGQKLRLVFNIEKSDAGISATMDSPDQNAYGIPVSEATFEDSKLFISITPAGIKFEGTLAGDSISGTFSQMGSSFPMTLSKNAQKVEKPKRPQEPDKPYPYVSENITFENTEAGIHLSGTLTLPDAKGKYPAVVLISGSGQQNRDEELMGHKPFLVLADHLTRNGIAVLRFDDRGAGESGGDFSKATSFDFATDVKAAIDYLKSRKEIDPATIGLMGHSEGGIVAPVVASQHPDEVGYIVLLAGPGLPGSEIVMMQQQLIGKASGMPEDELELAVGMNKQIFDLIDEIDNSEELQKKVRDLFHKKIKQNPEMVPEGMEAGQFIDMQLSLLLTPWMKNFLTYDPVLALKKVRCPVLALNGEKDLQVPPKENLEIIRETLENAGNNNVSTIELKGLNHLFQECETGLPSEYGQIEQTMSPIALNTILKWVEKQVE
ncbi:MAG: alpha/beta fold hydrolase [Bacteroidales bacterium]|nr:alpha/beta fold hydrolase [Bacteroidales bacterium]